MCSDVLQVHRLLKSNIDFHSQLVVGNKVVCRGVGYMCVLHTSVVATVLITVTEYLMETTSWGEDLLWLLISKALAHSLSAPGAQAGTFMWKRLRLPSLVRRKQRNENT